uniref:Uncharacterized protein n=1 Tax=Arundo donax TaxID=35708 RepID=A0A0A9E422_ARUDO
MPEPNLLKKWKTACWLDWCFTSTGQVLFHCAVTLSRSLANMGLSTKLSPRLQTMLTLLR